MMPNKRLLQLVPEAGQAIMLKVLLSWLNLVAGIGLWFAVGAQFELFSERRGLYWPFWLVALGCIGLRFLLIGYIARCTQRISACVKLRIRCLVYGKLLSLGPDYGEYFPTAELVQLAGEGVEQLESYYGQYIPQFFYAVLAPVTLLLVFLPLSPLTAVVLFLCVPLIPLAIAKVQRFAKKLLGRYWEAYANLGDSFLENLQGLTTLKVYKADGRRHAEMNDEAEHFRKITMKVLTMQLNSVTIMDLVAYGGSALGCILTAITFSSGRIDIGQAVAMVMLSAEFFLAMRALGSFFHTAMNGVAASERMFSLMGLSEPEFGNKPIVNGNIEIKQLDFSYDEGKAALHDINLKIEEGTMLAVVGESGSGKSTLAAILAGIRTRYRGHVRVGDLLLSEAAEESLRRLITVVSSNSYLFAGSVRETLAEGLPAATEVQMRAVLQQVALLDFVNAQGGLDFKLTERGENLSGGQRQRLALARALLKNSPIYIFDEATSNIDSESERVIMEAIKALRGQHTIILISHRLANVVEADHIAFLEQGMLLEQGTHETLCAARQGYWRLFSAQAELERYSREDVL